MPLDLLLPFVLFCAAMLYSSVGHGGASAYLAIMALIGMAPEEMRITALTLNLFVSAIAFWQFARAGAFNARLFAIFAAASIPTAYLGGRVTIPPEYYRTLVGVVLIVSAILLVWQVSALAAREPRPPSLAVALPAGGGLGLLAGLTGTGGGIYLSPLILLLGWEDARKTAGIAAAFIFVNSAAGLLGQAHSLAKLPANIGWMVAAVVIGGFIGSTLSASRLPRETLLKLLAVVLLIAGGKLIAT